MDLHQARLEDQRDQVERDLLELDEQVAAGEIDEQTAAKLRATYVAEGEEVASALAEIAASEGAAPLPRSKGRTLAGVAIVVAGLAVIGFGVTRFVEGNNDRVAAGVPADVLSGNGVDLASVTNEQLEEVVAANPSIVDMRLALARRYFQGSEFSDALRHYMIVLDDGPHPEALANVGWMLYLSGEVDNAILFFEESLAAEPGYGPAMYFLADATYSELQDAAGAMALLDQLLASDQVGADVRGSAEGLRDTINAAEGNAAEGTE